MADQDDTAKSRPVIIILLVFAFILLSVSAVYSFVELSHNDGKIVIESTSSNEKIRSQMFRITPQGLSERECWHLIGQYVSCEDGYPVKDKDNGIKLLNQNPIGTHSIVLAAKSAVIFCPFTSEEIFVRWAFDKQDKLLDIAVEQASGATRNPGAKIVVDQSSSEEDIRSRMFWLTPVGLSENECLSLIKQNVPCQEGYPKIVEKNSIAGPDKHPIGTHSIVLKACNSNFFNPFVRQETYITWAFDKHNKLLDIAVKRESIEL